MYRTLDTLRLYLDNWAAVVGAGRSVVDSHWNPLRNTYTGRMQSACLETTERLLKSYPKQSWDFLDLEINGKSHEVTATVVAEKPFCKLIKFSREGLPKNAPKILFVAAMSGHHATLSKDTLREFLPDYEVYITDWKDAKTVPADEGRFGFSEYIEYVIDFLQQTGQGTHLVCLCQAGVQGLAATAIMSKSNDKYKPTSVSFLASPIDMRANNNVLTKVSEKINMNLLRAMVIHKPSLRHPGKDRRVYPGMFQVANFIALGVLNHVKRHIGFTWDVFRGDFQNANKFKKFYDEYLSVMDCTEEFYMETLHHVFKEHTLPKGELFFNGQRVDCSDITDTPVLTIEGEKDNMVSIGQCSAVLKLCSQLPDTAKHCVVQEGVGHYGIFSGSQYRQHIAPLIKNFINTNVVGIVDGELVLGAQLPTKDERSIGNARIVELRDKLVKS